MHSVSVVLLLFVLLLAPLSCMGALVVYEYDLSDTTCSGAPVLSYAIPTTCTSWPFPNYPPQYMYALCNSTTNMFTYTRTTNDPTCAGNSDFVAGLNTCQYSSTTINYRGNYAPFKLACSESPIPTPSAVATYTLSNPSNCTDVYYQINVYKRIPSGATAVCVNGDLYSCGTNGIVYTSFSSPDCTSGLNAGGIIPYGSCTSITWPSLVYPVSIGYSAQKCSSLMSSANIVNPIWGVFIIFVFISMCFI